ncbi:site-specific integrase [Mucilaginibacter flavus]|uniref:site-specific integrase n=1 Tax=Mucilaginibacter flavus TaxID=931504 RepID=UPI0025B486AA|nr:site-specific integrase [Mucilaginibacter flavus]MDN3579648.1 phage integrase SAM-like domain-containing protein [Mucilaginibacter flavus]
MKNHQKLTLLFWHRKSKADAKGYAPVICRISIEGEEPEELAIGRKVHINNWDIENKIAKGSSLEKKTNLKISEVAVDLNREFTILQAGYDHITPLMVKNVYNGLPPKLSKGLPKPEAKIIPTLLQVTDLHISNFKKMVDKKLRSGETLKQWNATRKKIEEFLVTHFRIKDMDLEAIDYSFAVKFYNYLTIDREKVLGEAAAKKQIKNTKEILTFAETSTWILKNPIIKFKCGGDETDIPPLEYFEVERIWNKEITIQRLAEVRDAFIFQCFTGFAFQDVFALTTENIIRVGIIGERWLIKDRGKTGVSETVPILPIIDELIEKYKYHLCRKDKGLLIPVNSNARYNGYLKELAVICGINRELNTHLARHTFADIMLNIMEFSLEEVSKMLGHKTTRTTQRYAKVKRNKISKTLARVKGIVFTADGQLRKIAC